jgi:hypothetical protein
MLLETQQQLQGRVSPLDRQYALTALSLLAAFKDKADIDVVDIGDPIVLSGALIGAMFPFLFSALTMLSVQKVSYVHNLLANLFAFMRWN